VSEAWWPVALAEDVIPGKPKGVFIDDEPIVLFRDNEGMVRALENRCPHRRAPLSLGTVREEGWLQCGYHGWSFDGVTGKCKAIPNLRANEPVPSTYGVFPYRVAEHLGFVYIAAHSSAHSPPAALYEAGTNNVAARQIIGRQVVGLARDEYIAALMDGPHLLLRCQGIRIAHTMAMDPQWRDGWLVMERPAFWVGQSTFDAFVREYKLLFQLAVRRGTGEAWIAFAQQDGCVIAATHWGIVPSARGTTVISWRSFAPSAPGLRPALLRRAVALGRAPIAPDPSLNMAAVATLLVGPSECWPRDRQRTGIYGELLATRRATI
jgi:nitrite reductase/ring-hydroxylating ferredoxin subunit